MQLELGGSARRGDMSRPSPRVDVRALSDRLVDGLRLMRIATTSDQVARLVAFVALLEKWNATYNLTSVRDPGDMLTVHVLDSLAILPLVDRYARDDLLDVGSGAGLPGIPLAVLRPALVVRTVDAVAKKIGFQLHVRTALPVTNLEPRHARIEQLPSTSRPSLIVSRAYSELTEMLASIDHLVAPDTTVLAMKGAEPVAEIARVPAPWSVRDVVALDVPFLGARRCAVVLARQA